MADDDFEVELDEPEEGDDPEEALALDSTIIDQNADLEALMQFAAENLEKMGVGDDTVEFVVSQEGEPGLSLPEPEAPRPRPRALPTRLAVHDAEEEPAPSPAAPEPPSPRGRVEEPPRSKPGPPTAGASADSLKVVLARLSAQGTAMSERAPEPEPRGPSPVPETPIPAPTPVPVPKNVPRPAARGGLPGLSSGVRILSLVALTISVAGVAAILVGIIPLGSPDAFDPRQAQPLPVPSPPSPFEAAPAPEKKVTAAQGTVSVPHEVKISFKTWPKDAAIRVNGLPHEGALIVPRSALNYNIDVSAPGFKPERWIIPADEDRELSLRLERLVLPEGASQ